jgi:hypothetical protein
MKDTNFYVTIKNHFNHSDIEKAQARKEELDDIMDDMDIVPYSYNDESWVGTQYNEGWGF